MTATGFSGMLSRKQRMNNAATSSRVANPAAAAKARSYAGASAATGTDGAPVTVIATTRDVEVISDEQGRAIREEISNERNIVAGMHQDAVDVIPIQKPTPTRTKDTDKPKATAKPKATPKPKAAAPNQESPKALEKPRYTLLQYSEKCMALFGDTKPIKEELKKIGGRYNPNLHPFTKDQSVPGWIFANKAKADLEALISNH